MTDIFWISLVVAAAVIGWLRGDEHGEKRTRREWQSQWKIEPSRPRKPGGFVSRADRSEGSTIRTSDE